MFYNSILNYVTSYQQISGGHLWEHYVISTLYLYYSTSTTSYYSSRPLITRTVYNEGLFIPRILVAPLF